MTDVPETVQVRIEVNGEVPVVGLAVRVTTGGAGFTTTVTLEVALGVLALRQVMSNI